MRHGGLGVGLGSFFVGFRGRVRVGDTIWGVIYNRGKDLFSCFHLFTLPATPATPREIWGFRVVFVGFRGRVRVGDTIWGVINNRGNIRICLRFFVYLPYRPPRPPLVRYGG